MKLILEIEFTSALPKVALEEYGRKLEKQMEAIYRNTPGVSREFVGISHKVTE